MADDQTPEQHNEQTPLEKLGQAIQDFVNATWTEDGPVLVDTSLVVWEQMRYDPSGDLVRKVNYAIPSTNASLSATVGLLRISDELIASDILPSDDE